MRPEVAHPSQAPTGAPIDTLSLPVPLHVGTLGKPLVLQGGTSPPDDDPPNPLDASDDLSSSQVVKTRHAVRARTKSKPLADMADAGTRGFVL